MADDFGVEVNVGFGNGRHTAELCGYGHKGVESSRLDQKVKSHCEENIASFGDVLDNKQATKAERWLSGLKRTPGKREWAYTPPGVRISLSPPLVNPSEVIWKIAFGTGLHADDLF